MYIEYVIPALVAVPLLGFAAGVYWEVRKGRTLGEGAQVGCAFWMLVQLLTFAASFWLCNLFPHWFIP